MSQDEISQSPSLFSCNVHVQLHDKFCVENCCLKSGVYAHGIAGYGEMGSFHRAASDGARCHLEYFFFNLMICANIKIKGKRVSTGAFG